MAGRTSLKDIATATGVSVSTVSLALSGDVRVAAPTRERIKATAHRLGYVRNPILASIAAGHFRHPGKPVCVAVSGEDGGWLAPLRAQAEAMGMSVRSLSGSVEQLPERAVAVGATALVLNCRGLDLRALARSSLSIVLWEDEGPANPPVDLIETCEWWTATSTAIERVRAAGYRAPAAFLVPAIPRHWHDDIRLACARIMGLPAIEWSSDTHAVGAFFSAHRPDAVILGMPHLYETLTQLGINLPHVSLLVHTGPWFANFTGWTPDQDHRGQVTLELIEQRLRYGPRPPRRIVVPPHWQEGTSLPSRV